MNRMNRKTTMQRPAEWDRGEPFTGVPKESSAAVASPTGTAEPAASSAAEGLGRVTVESATQAIPPPSTIPE